MRYTMHNLFKIVLDERDLSRAGDLFSLRDDEIDEDLSLVLDKIRVISSCSSFLYSDNDQSIVEICVTRVTSAIRENDSISLHIQALVRLLLSCIHCKLCLDDNGEHPPHAKIVSDLLSCIFLNYSKNNVMEASIPVAVQFLLSESYSLTSHLTSYLSLAAIANAELLADNLSVLITSIAKGNTALLRVVCQTYSNTHRLSVLEPHSPVEVNLARELCRTRVQEHSYLCQLMQLFVCIGKHNPKLIYLNLDGVLKMILEQDKISDALDLLKLLNTLAQNDPNPFFNCLDTLSIFSCNLTIPLTTGIISTVGKQSATHRGTCISVLCTIFCKQLFITNLQVLVNEISSLVNFTSSDSSGNHLHVLQPFIDDLDRHLLCNDLYGNQNRLDQVKQTLSALKHRGSQYLPIGGVGGRYINGGGDNAASMAPLVANLGDSQTTFSRYDSSGSCQNRTVAIQTDYPVISSRQTSNGLPQSSSTCFTRRRPVSVSSNSTRRHTSSLQEIMDYSTQSNSNHHNDSSLLNTSTMSQALAVLPEGHDISSPSSQSRYKKSKQSRASIIETITPQSHHNNYTPINSTSSNSSAPNNYKTNGSKNNRILTRNQDHNDHNIRTTSIRSKQNSDCDTNSLVSVTPVTASYLKSQVVPDLTNDPVQHFCTKHITKINAYVDTIKPKIPLPIKTTVEGVGKKRLFCLHFICMGQGEQCLYKQTFFTVKTKRARIWLHLMFLALQSRSQKPIRQQDSSVINLKNSWDKLKDSASVSEFVRIVTSPFPSSKDINSLTKELTHLRYFDALVPMTVNMNNDLSTQWVCPLCLDPRPMNTTTTSAAAAAGGGANSPVGGVKGKEGGVANKTTNAAAAATIAMNTLDKNGKPSMQGQLQEKNGGRWKFMRRWKTRYFTLSAGAISYSKKHSSKMTVLPMNTICSVKALTSADDPDRPLNISRRTRHIPTMFEIFTTTSETIVLKAHSQQAAEQWVHCLQAAINKPVASSPGNTWESR